MSRFNSRITGRGTGSQIPQGGCGMTPQEQCPPYHIWSNGKCIAEDPVFNCIPATYIRLTTAQQEVLISLTNPLEDVVIT